MYQAQQGVLKATRSKDWLATLGDMTLGKTPSFSHTRNFPDSVQMEHLHKNGEWVVKCRALTLRRKSELDTKAESHRLMHDRWIYYRSCIISLNDRCMMCAHRHKVSRCYTPPLIVRRRRAQEPDEIFSHLVFIYLVPLEAPFHHFLENVITFGWRFLFIITSILQLSIIKYLD